MVRFSSPEVTSIAEDEEVLQKGVGLAHSSFSVLRFQGPDRKDFLQGALSNDLRNFKKDQVLPAFHLTPKGKWIASVKLFEKDEALWALTSPTEAKALQEGIKTLIQFSQTTLQDLSSDYVWLEVTGSKAIPYVAELFQIKPDSPILVHHPVTLNSILLEVVRDFDRVFPLFFVLAPRAELTRVWNAFTSTPFDFPVREISSETLERLRIEACQPAYGVDVDEKTLPPEANLDEDYISYTKGCYVGQEVISRLKHYGRTQRRLVRLEIETTSPLPKGTSMFYEGKEVGKITSAAFSPRLGGVVALAFLARDLTEKGKVLQIKTSSGEPEATVM